MELERFAADYGTLPASFFGVGRVTNVAELLRGEPLYRVLRLCGVPETENGERASDWELFQSLCRAYPLLVGHPMRRELAAFLQLHFSIDEPLCAENAERIWRTTADALEQNVRSGADFLPAERVPWLCGASELPMELPPRVIPVLLVNSLMENRDVTLDGWREQIRDALDAFCAKGCDRLVLRVEPLFAFSSPNPYRVGQLLAKRRTVREEEQMLLAQLVREICAYVATRGMPLSVEVKGELAETARLLEYTEQSVGLPPCLICTDSVSATDAAIDFIAREHQRPMRLSLRVSDYPSEAELARACACVAARYPFGRLAVITAADLRRLSGVQRYFDEIFCKMF